MPQPDEYAEIRDKLAALLSGKETTLYPDKIPGDKLQALYDFAVSYLDHMGLSAIKSLPHFNQNCNSEVLVALTAALPVLKSHSAGNILYSALNRVMTSGDPERIADMAKVIEKLGVKDRDLITVLGGLAPHNFDNDEIRMIAYSDITPATFAE